MIRRKKKSRWWTGMKCFFFLNIIVILTNFAFIICQFIFKDNVSHSRTVSLILRWLKINPKNNKRELTGGPRVPRAPFRPASPGWPIAPRVPISPTRPVGPFSPCKDSKAQLIFAKCYEGKIRKQTVRNWAFLPNTSTFITFNIQVFISFKRFHILIRDKNAGLGYKTMYQTRDSL